MSASIGAADDTGVDIILDCIVESGDVIKTFICDADMNPLAYASDIVAV